MTTLINFIAGPGVGKSTKAAELYAKMKELGYSVELVREVAKEWAWEKRKINEFDQVYLAGQQIRKESMLFGKVDYIITDSPVLLAGFYMERNHKHGYLTEMIKSYYSSAELHKVKTKNYILTRQKEYDPNGRFESEEEVNILDIELEKYFEYFDLKSLKTNSIDDILKNLGCGYCITPCNNKHCVTKG